MAAGGEKREVSRLGPVLRSTTSQGAEVAAQPTDHTYGIREFGVRDINGVGIVFWQDIGHA